MDICAPSRWCLYTDDKGKLDRSEISNLRLLRRFLYARTVFDRKHVDINYSKICCMRNCIIVKHLDWNIRSWWYFYSYGKSPVGIFRNKQWILLRQPLDAETAFKRKHVELTDLRMRLYRNVMIPNDEFISIDKSHRRGSWLYCANMLDGWLPKRLTTMKYLIMLQCVQGDMDRLKSGEGLEKSARFDGGTLMDGNEQVRKFQPYSQPISSNATLQICGSPLPNGPVISWLMATTNSGSGSFPVCCPTGLW